jgi:hypothetical protein
MKAVGIGVFCLLSLCLLAAHGCGKKADEARPISEVKAEADKMSVPDLQAWAKTYRDAIVAKKAEVEKVAARVKEIPLAEMLGEEAKNLKAELEDLQNSVAALTERFQVYYDKLKEKGGNTSGLDI